MSSSLRMVSRPHIPFIRHEGGCPHDDLGVCDIIQCQCVCALSVPVTWPAHSALDAGSCVRGVTIVLTGSSHAPARRKSTVSTHPTNTQNIGVRRGLRKWEMDSTWPLKWAFASWSLRPGDGLCVWQRGGVRTAAAKTGTTFESDRVHEAAGANF